MSHSTATSRLPRQRFYISPYAEPTPIPPRLRSGSGMLAHMRSASSTQLHDVDKLSHPADQVYAEAPRKPTNVDWFDNDEFSIQGPLVVNSPVSTATIPQPSTIPSPRTTLISSNRPPPFVSPPPQRTPRTRALSSPPIFDLGSSGYPVAQFPFPKQRDQMEATDNDAVRARFAQWALLPSSCSCSPANPSERGTWSHDEGCEYAGKVSGQEAEAPHDSWMKYSSNYIAWP